MVLSSSIGFETVRRLPPQLLRGAFWGTFVLVMECDRHWARASSLSTGWPGDNGQVAGHFRFPLRRCVAASLRRRGGGSSRGTAESIDIADNSSTLATRYVQWSLSSAARRPVDMGQPPDEPLALAFIAVDKEESSSPVILLRKFSSSRLKKGREDQRSCENRLLFNVYLEGNMS